MLPSWMNQCFEWTIQWLYSLIHWLSINAVQIITTVCGLYGQYVIHLQQNKRKHNAFTSKIIFCFAKHGKKCTAKDTSDTSFKTGQMKDANQRQPHDVATLIYSKDASFHLRSTRSSLFRSYINQWCWTNQLSKDSMTHLQKQTLVAVYRHDYNLWKESLETSHR